jgi:hypothetical protein
MQKLLRLVSKTWLIFGFFALFAFAFGGEFPGDAHIVYACKIDHVEEKTGPQLGIKTRPRRRSGIAGIRSPSVTIGIMAVITATSSLVKSFSESVSVTEAGRSLITVSGEGQRPNLAACSSPPRRGP